jgi:hypothetical protein
MSAADMVMPDEVEAFERRARELLVGLRVDTVRYASYSGFPVRINALELGRRGGPVFSFSQEDWPSVEPGELRGHHFDSVADAADPGWAGVLGREIDDVNVLGEVTVYGSAPWSPERMAEIRPADLELVFGEDRVLVSPLELCDGAVVLEHNNLVVSFGCESVRVGDPRPVLLGERFGVTEKNGVRVLRVPNGRDGLWRSQTVVFDRLAQSLVGLQIAAVRYFDSCGPPFDQSGPELDYLDGGVLLVGSDGRTVNLAPVMHVADTIMIAEGVAFVPSYAGIWDVSGGSRWDQLLGRRVTNVRVARMDAEPYTIELDLGGSRVWVSAWNDELAVIFDENTARERTVLGWF